jgi:hypothetical protein
MTTYNLSYFIKSATKFEEGATVTAMGNGWFYVIKKIDAPNNEEAIRRAQETVFPFDSFLHNLDLSPSLSSYVPHKVKRKAAWKQNPLNRYSKGNK